jgi:glycine betaine transporter
MSLRMSPFSGSTWVADWTIFYWAWWISWAPFVGSFIARISRGRSVREFVIGVVLAPTLLGFFWFAVFGGTALWAQIFGHADLVQALGNGYDGAVHVVRQHAAAAAAVVHRAGAADDLLRDIGRFGGAGAGQHVHRRSRRSAAEAQAGLGHRGGADRSGLLLAGGLDALQGMITIAALPFALLMVLVMVSLYRVLDQEYTRERRQAQRQRHMIDAWIAREMAAQEETQAEAARAQDQD